LVSVTLNDVDQLQQSGSSIWML